MVFHQYVDEDLVYSDCKSSVVEMLLPDGVLGSNFSGEAENTAISSRPRRCTQKPVARRKPSQEKPYPKPASQSRWRTELVDQILNDDDEDEPDCPSSFERG